MEIKHFETHGRKLLVEFTCRRCGHTDTRPFQDCVTENECYNNLWDARPPKGWQNGGFYYPLFCSKCAEAHARFMAGEEVTP